MKINQAGIDLIKRFEDLFLKSYKCPNDIWTIGWGHTGGVSEGQTITVKQAEAFLDADLVYFESLATKALKYPVNDNQFSAFVSILFNVGPGNAYKDGILKLKSGAPSTLLKRINEGNLLAAANEFEKWNRAGGRILNGLTKRRKAEKELFLTAA